VSVYRENCVMVTTRKLPRGIVKSLGWMGGMLAYAG
jgi:hypothetical protein